MSSKCNCGKLLEPGFTRCRRREKTEPVNPLKDVHAMRMLVTDLEAERTARKALEEALETCLRYADSGVAAVTAELVVERVARKALEEALWRSNRECCQIGHPHADQHAHDAPCPVEVRIAAALALAAKLP